MIKIYDKFLLFIAVLVLAGGGFLYMQKSGATPSLNVPADVQPAANPYLPEIVSSPTPEEINWPEASEQSTGWRYDVFTPPKIFIDENGQFSEEGWEPPEPPSSFGIYLAQIERKPYRIQIQGYMQEDPTDVSKVRLIMFDEEAQKTVLARPGEEKSDAEFKLLSFVVERLRNEDNNIEKVARATILDLRSGEEVVLIEGERRYDSGFTVVIRSDEDASFNIELAEAAFEFEGPMGHYTLLEISLDESSIKVNKHSTDTEEEEIRILNARADDTSSMPLDTTPVKNAPEKTENFLDMF
tara:strand:- start:265 stop:1158 length:894 start_codon:yes stop_codon:yes gene_type:complete